MRFDHLTIEDGVSHSQVTAIVQDQQGFLWFGTRAGLDRFDGYECRAFTHSPDDSNGLSGNFILALAVTRDGKLWIGTAGEGIDCYDPATERFESWKDGLDNDVNVLCIHEDRAGRLWAGTSRDLILVRRDSGRTRLQHLSPGYVHAIFEDADGTLWLGTDEGLKAVSPAGGGPTVDSLPIGTLPARRVMGIVAARGGGLLAGLEGGGLYRLTPGARSATKLGDAQVWSMMRDHRGELWIGTVDQGLICIPDESADNLPSRHYRHDEDDPWSIGANQINAIFEEPSGRMWFGTKGGGVSMVDLTGEKFRTYRHVPRDPGSLGHNNVRAFAEDREGNLWLGTYGGGIDLLAHGTRRFRHIRQAPRGLPGNLINSLLISSDGKLWIGTTQEGLSRYNPSTSRFTRYRRPRDDSAGVRAAAVISLLEDHAGYIWIGTHGNSGLSRYDPSEGRFDHFAVEDPRTGAGRSDRVWALHEDRAGNLWLGTPKHGLFRLDRERSRFTEYRHITGDAWSISEDPVICIADDPEGFLWVGTAGGGLHRLDPATGRFTRFTEKDGLPDNMIYGILIDSSSTLWVSTGKGIAEFRPGAGVLRSFDSNDGLQANEFNQRSCFQTGDGRLLFGGINGFTMFRPERIVRNPNPPPVVITRFAVFGRTLSLPSSVTLLHEIVLEHDQSFFSFEFAALDFTAPEKNAYAYRLQGFDPDWVQAGSRRLASYTNVGPGTYVFQVQGSNNDGVWNEEGASIVVRILPPYWETWPFRIFVLCLLGGMLYLLYRYRVNRLLAVERTRTRIARDLHDEVSAILSGISYFSQSVAHDASSALSETSAHFMSQISKSSAEVLELFHDIIWSINPENDRLGHIVAEVRRYASDLCDTRSIRHEIVTPESLPDHEVEMDRRKNFWLVYKEMVGNAVRHSGCTELRVRLAVERNGALWLHVSDNGKGFEPDRATTRNGVKNIRVRAGLLGAELRLDSSPGTGTRWDMRCALW